MTDTISFPPACGASGSGGTGKGGGYYFDPSPLLEFAVNASDPSKDNGGNLFIARRAGGSLGDLSLATAARDKMSRDEVEKYNKDPLRMIMLQYKDAHDDKVKNLQQNRVWGNYQDHLGTWHEGYEWVDTFNHDGVSLDLGTHKVEELLDGPIYKQILDQTKELAHKNEETIEDIKKSSWTLDTPSNTLSPSRANANINIAGNTGLKGNTIVTGNLILNGSPTIAPPTLNPGEYNLSTALKDAEVMINTQGKLELDCEKVKNNHFKDTDTVTIEAKHDASGKCYLEFHATGGGAGDYEFIKAADLAAITDDPSDVNWGNPSKTKATIVAAVTDQFANAPTGINAGEYHGILTKVIAPNGFESYTYSTVQGRLYKKTSIQETDGTAKVGQWQEVGEVIKQAIWTLKGNAATSTISAADTPIIFAIEDSKFNAVESDFQGHITYGSDQQMQFSVTSPGAYEVQIHGVIEDSTQAAQKVAVSLMYEPSDGASKEDMTGSLQLLAPAATWGGASEYSFNCTGFGRLTPSGKVSLQVVSDTAATLVLKQCIVILKPLK